MKIGFDAKRAIQNNTGLGNYSRYMIEILSDLYPENSYLLFAPKERKNSRLQKLQMNPNISFHYPQGINKYFPSVWRSNNIKSDLKSNQIDIFHGLSNELPFGIQNTGIKSVVTIHDLIFLRYPEYYKRIDRTIYTRKFRYACECSDRIIAISECTKRDIISFFGIPANKIDVVYQGCHPNFNKLATKEKKEEVVKKYNLPPLFLLSVGSIEPRKNLMLIAKALKHLREEIHLVVVGKKTYYQDLVQEFCDENGISDRVHIFNNYPFEDLPALYQLSRIFIFPSFFEGFGIPVIEALSSGTPVIAAKGSCLEEAGGPDSIYIDPDNEFELADQVQTVIHDQELSAHMSLKGNEYVKIFSDKNIATKLISLYQSL